MSKRELDLIKAYRLGVVAGANAVVKFVIDDSGVDVVEVSEGVYELTFPDGRVLKIQIPDPPEKFLN